MGKREFQEAPSHWLRMGYKVQSIYSTSHKVATLYLVGQVTREKEKTALLTEIPLDKK